VTHWKLRATREERELKGPKYPRRTLVGETLGQWRGGQGPIGSQLGKRLIESGMFADGSDIILGRIPVKGTQL